METMKLINNIMIGPIKIFTLMLCNMTKKDWGSLKARYFVTLLRVFAKLAKKKILK